MSSVFGEDHRPPTEQPSAQHGLKERRVLVSVQDLSTLAICKFSEPFCTATINSGLTTQVLNNKSILTQAMANLSDLIQHGDDAAEFVVQEPNHLIH